MSDDFRPLRTFGRIKSRPIKPRQAALMDTLLPRIRVPERPFDPRDAVGDGGQVWLEIGFGGGEHLATQAERRPLDAFIGAEPFLNGVASALRHVDERGLANVRLHPGDVRELMERMPDASVDRIIILFPDPWPKARHHKRRLVQDDFLTEAARLLKPGGRLRFATDWEDYANWTLRKLTARSEFNWLAQRADDWRKPPADHVTTRYEEKRLGDCEPIWLEFERL